MIERTRRRMESDRGFVLTFAALLFGLLLGLSGMSLDVGNWYLHIQRTQRAADAAALAGAPYLPNDPVAAEAAAQETLIENGEGNATVTFNGPDPAKPAYMVVTMGRTVPNLFFRFLGYDEFSYQRTAIGSYRGAILIGSPDNVLGREPAVLGRWSALGTGNEYMLGQNSAGYSKTNADRWSPIGCATSGPSDPAPDLCTGGLNDEYDPDGKTFAIEVPPGSTGTLAVEVYDPLFAGTAANCDSSVRYRDLAVGWPGPMPFPPNFARYADDPSVCAGDVAPSLTTPLNTKFALWSPVNSPTGTQPIDDGITCRPRIYTPLPVTASGAADLPVWQGILSAGPTLYGTDPASTFHRWTRVCTLNIDNVTHKAGRYILHAEILDDDTSQLKNRYAIRAGYLDSGGNYSPSLSAGVTVSGENRLTTVSQSDSQDLTFWIARLAKYDTGRSVRLQTYDLGDRQLTSMRIYMGDGRPVTSCKMSWLNGAHPPQTSLSGCTISSPGSSTWFRSSVVNFDIQMPDMSSCSTETAMACWLKMDIRYAVPPPSGAEDGVSWKVESVGKSLRLYEPGGY